jgi:hypothetical protein
MKSGQHSLGGYGSMRAMAVEVNESLVNTIDGVVFDKDYSSHGGVSERNCVALQ